MDSGGAKDKHSVEVARPLNTNAVSNTEYQVPTEEMKIEQRDQTCRACRYFNIDTCMHPQNKKNGIRPAVDIGDSCRFFKYGKWEVKAEGRRDVDPKFRTCGNCKSRERGFCVGRVFSPAVISGGKVVKAPGFVDIRESVDRDEPACTLFDPVPNSKLTHEAPLPVNARQLVRVVRCCGECVFFLNGICMNVKWQRELGLSDRPKVEYFAKACKMNKSVLEELK